MATKNFTQFSTTTLTTADFVVGYKADGSAEFRSQIKDVVNLVQDSDAQTLLFDENTKDLSISSGNTVSLSSLSDTAFATVSGSFATNTALNAASGNAINYTQSNFFPLTGGIISGETRINNNLTVFGNLTATGTTTFANTVFSTTSSLSVVHIGSGPAMWVGNNGTGDIASFYDIDQNVEILHVGGNNGTFPNVGVKTSQPNKTLTVVGEISATSDITNTGKIFTTGGNSDQWNQASSTSTAYQNASGSFATVTLTRTLTGQLLPTSIYQGASGNWQNTFNNAVTSVNNLTGRNITFYVTPSTDVRVFTNSGTWTKPLSARSIHVALIGGGGGGGSGRYDNSGTARGGGSGGGGGGFTTITLNADAVPDTVFVTVGAGGPGGAAQTTLASSGNPGTPGGQSIFGAWGRSTGGSGGEGGTAATLTTRTAAGVGMFTGGDGGVGQVGTSTANRPGGNAISAGGGGGGGGCGTGNANSQGGDGGLCNIIDTVTRPGGTGGLTNGGAGGNGNTTGVNRAVPGSGAGGGGGANVANGGTGGAGGLYGGGGGGGAGSNGSQSGAGGAGANGIVVVTTYF